MMVELFMISLFGVALGFAMIWAANRSQAQRIAQLERQNDRLQQQLSRNRSTKPYARN
jgi:hypothetical protein